MRIAAAVALLVIATHAGAATVAVDFERDAYVPGPLAGQQGWASLVADGTATVITGDNGPASPGQQSLELRNNKVTGQPGQIRLRLNLPGNIAAGNPLVKFQYDVKDVTNKDAPNSDPPGVWTKPTTFRTRLYDAAQGYAAIGNMHYDGGGGPAHQAWVGLNADGSNSGWDPDGSPAWTDTRWHTIAWTLDYSTKRFVKITFDGVDYSHSTWFADWNGATAGGVAQTADWLEVNLFADSGGAVWRVDNYMITTTPEPASLVLLGLGSLLLRRRRA